MRHSPSCLLLALCLTTLPTAVVGQGPCTLEFVSGDPMAGVDGPLATLLPWDPDGAGPLPMHVVAGGSFEVAGEIIGPNIAAYEPVSGQWLALGQGLPGLVRDVTKRPNGNLIAASDAGGVFEYDGTSWLQLGGNFTFPPNAVAVLPNGEVVAGGAFTLIGGVPINGIARWDGTTWHAMGSPSLPSFTGTVNYMDMLPGGDLVVIGLFTQIGGVACSHVARWDGTTWHPLGAGSTSLPYSMIVTTTGELVVNGTFATSTGTARVARWNGSAWIDVGAGLPMNFVRLALLPNGELIAAGSAGIWSANAATWSQFAPWPSGTQEIAALVALSNQDVLAAGRFEPSAIVPAHNFARWQAGTWQATSAGTDNAVTAVVERPDGSFFVGGHFSTIAGVATNRLAHFDHGTWTAIASTAIGPIRHAIARPDGEVVLVGEFPNQTTGGMDFVMRWNGGQVTPVYGGLWGAKIVNAMALAKNGDVMFAYTDYATFGGGLARWDGTTLTFTPLASALLNALLEMPNGDWLLSIGLGNLQRWNGTTLTAFAPSLTGTVFQLGRLPNGDIIAAGAINTPMRIARWDGVTWQPFGAGLTDSITSLTVLPNGDVIACERRFYLQGWATRVQHWQGNTWKTLADTAGQADAIWANAGAVVMYGEFTTAGGAANAYLARLEPTCQADVQDLGGGCIGAAGPLQLTAFDRAWIGATLNTSASTLPTGSLSIGLLGSSATAQPLSSLHPLGTPGCNLLVTADILLPFSVSSGSTSFEIFVPDATALVGAQFHHQLLNIEVSATGNLAAITSSNALLLTIGAL